MSVHTVFILLIVVAFSDQHCGRRHKHCDRTAHAKNYGRIVFEEVSQAVIDADTKIKTNCEKNKNGETKEIFDLTRSAIALLTPLIDFSETDIRLEIRNRLLYINAYKSDPERRYTEFIELPAVADTRGARFKVDSGTLKIVLPLKNSTSCADTVDGEVINVPVLAMADIEAKFGQD